MIFKNKILLAAILVVSFSCASNFEEEKKQILKTEDKKDLVQSFDMSEVDTKKFQEKEIAASSNVKVEPVITPKKDKKAKKEEITKSPKIEVKPETKPMEVQDVYPEGYPAEYIQYDKKSKDVWKKFKPFFFKGEKTIMSVSYLGVVAGYITIDSKKVVNINNKDAYQFNARFKSREAYSYFYWLDDTLENFVEKDTFLPIKYTLIQREKRQNVDDLQLFDFEKLKTFTFYKRVKKDANKDEKLAEFIPRYAQDSFSALQFVRGLPLNKGDKYEFPVITRGKPWLLKVEVEGTEDIEVMEKEVSAIRIKAETHFPGVLKKSGDINFWYSNDEFRNLLKFRAQVKIGSINGEVVEYSPGERAKQ